MSWDKVAADAKPDADTFSDKIIQTAAEGSTSTARTKGVSGGSRVPSFMNRSRMLAWLRSKGQSPVYTNGKDGWKTLEMQLKNGDGLLTVRTRQGKDRMAVSVGFSDARMRAQAAANANQLQELLQSQYDTNVDFSLMGDGTNDAHQHAASDQAQRRTGSNRLTADTAETNQQTTSTRRALAPGARHEWIG